MSGFQMLNIDRVRGTLTVGLTDTAKSFDPMAVVLWLRTVQDSYQKNGCKMSFDAETKMFLINAGAGALETIATMSEPGRLLLEVITKACSMPAKVDFDENLELISLVLGHARSIRESRDKPKLRYSIRKTRSQNSTTLIVTLRSDVHGSFGLEAGLLVTSALVAALERERKKQIYVINPPIPDDTPRGSKRPVEKFSNYLDWHAKQIFVDHVLRLTTEELQGSLGSIKAVRNYFQGLSLSAQEGEASQ